MPILSGTLTNYILAPSPSYLRLPPLGLHAGQPICKRLSTPPSCCSLCSLIPGFQTLPAPITSLRACRSANVQEALNTAIMLVDVSYPKWRILFCNIQVDKATGLSGSEISGQHVWDHFNVVGKAEVGFNSHLGSASSMCLSICLSVCLSCCLSIHLCTSLTVRLCVCQSVSPCHFRCLCVCVIAT